MRQRLAQAQLFPATDAPSSAGQVPATDLLSSAAQVPATNAPSLAGQLPATIPLSSAGQVPATNPLSSAGQVPATVPLSSAEQFLATNPLSSAGQLPANRPSPAYSPSSIAGHVGSPLPGLPYSLDSASAAASTVPPTKAQSPAACEREVLQISELSQPADQPQAARPSMPASPIQPQPQLQAQGRSSLAPAQLQPQTMNCPSLPPEMTQQPTGTTAVALTHPEQPVGTTAVALTHPEQPLGSTAVDVTHPEQQQAMSHPVTGSFVAAEQAPNSAQVRLHRLFSASALLELYPIVTAACLAITLHLVLLFSLSQLWRYMMLRFRHPQLWRNKLPSPHL